MEDEKDYDGQDDCTRALIVHSDTHSFDGPHFVFQTQTTTTWSTSWSGLINWLGLGFKNVIVIQWNYMRYGEGEEFPNLKLFCFAHSLIDYVLRPIILDCE